MTDITSLINDTRREIGTRRVAGSGVRTIVLRRSYDVPIEDVWQACTDPDRLNRWFLEVSGDLRVGGRYQFEGNAGGEIVRCESPRLLTPDVAVRGISGQRGRATAVPGRQR